MNTLAWNAPAALQSVLDRVAVQRYSRFLALQAELLTLHADECARSDFLTHANDWLCLQAQEHAAMLRHPVFRVWMAHTLREMNLRFIARSTNPEVLVILLAEFPSMLQRIRIDLERGEHPTFYRLNIDPLLARALPPSYTMPETPEATLVARHAGHPLGFFKDVVGVALERIARTWQPAYSLVDNLVACIGYLPDGDFRSCSAERYSGLILLSSRDASLFDLEESIVHEAGHQLLYTLVELEPICKQPQELTDVAKAPQYKLPWSTQVRDIYGYYHAFFIYVLLARYLEHVVLRPAPEGTHAGARLRHIVRGLAVAVPDFDASQELTPYGQRLLMSLKRELAGLTQRQFHLLSPHV